MTSKLLLAYFSVCFEPMDDVIGSPVEQDAQTKEEVVKKAAEEFTKMIESIPDNCRCRMLFDSKILDYPEVKKDTPNET